MAVGPAAVGGLRLGPEGGRARSRGRVSGPVRLPEEAGRREVLQSEVRRARQAGDVPQRDTVRSYGFHRHNVAVSARTSNVPP